MKKFLCLVSTIILFIFSLYSTTYATERLVDIPVPPDNHGMADFTENEAAELQREYEQSVSNSLNEENVVNSERNEQKGKNNNFAITTIIIIILILILFIIIIKRKKYGINNKQ